MSELEPRAVPPVDTEVPKVAVQVGPQPTNKVSAATTAAGGIGGILSGAMAAYGGPALIEMLNPDWVAAHPNATQLLVLVVVGVGSALAIKYFGQSAAFNVLDAPNVPMKPVASPTAAAIQP